jgi:hypothetical protein
VISVKQEEVKVEKLPGPKEIPEIVAKHLTDQMKMTPMYVQFLKAVMYPDSRSKDAFKIRIFDESETEVKKIRVQNYVTLDQYPGLILYEGWFDKKTKQVELEEKRKLPDVPISTGAEIQQKIEALNKPGETVLFYTARGPAIGGPLGRGAAVIELNPNYPGKKQKKYNVYMANVDGMEPTDKGQKLFDSDKSKDLTKWIKESHHKRLY